MPPAALAALRPPAAPPGGRVRTRSGDQRSIRRIPGLLVLLGLTLALSLTATQATAEPPATLPARPEAIEFEPAIPDYERAVTLDPTDREAQESFGACYSIMAAEKADLKEFAEAAELMTKAITVYPHSAVFRHQRGSCYFHSGEYEKALSDLDEAIHMEPRKPDHHENRGHTLNRLGRAEEAEREFKKAEELRKQ